MKHRACMFIQNGDNDTNHYINYGMSPITVAQSRGKSYNSSQKKRSSWQLHKKKSLSRTGVNGTINSYIQLSTTTNNKYKQQRQ